MTGILLLVVVGFWIWASVQLTSLLLRRISSRMLRRVVAPAVFVALLVLPVLDEVIGRFQFRALCEDNAVLRINADEVKGKTVRLEIKPSNEVLLGQWLTTYHTRIGFRDTDSDREIGSYSSYVVKGGSCRKFYRFLMTAAGN